MSDQVADPGEYEDFAPRAVSSMAEGEVQEAPTTTEDAPQTGPEEPEPPIGPMQDVDKIISETEDIVLHTRNIAIDRRRFIALYLHHIQTLKTLLEDVHKEHLRRLNTFLVRNDLLQECWMRNFLSILPCYGDYTQVLSDTSVMIKVNEIPLPVKESSLKSLAEDVTNNLHASATLVKTMRAKTQEIDSFMNQCREISECNYFPYLKWRQLWATHLKSMDAMQEECFQIVSEIDRNDSFNQSGSSDSSTATLKNTSP